MNIKFTEEQIRYILKESIGDINNDSNESYNIASSLINNPSNEVVWRIFRRSTQDSIFTNGYTAEYFGNGEGTYHGPGVYSFYNIDGAYSRIKYQPQTASEGSIGDTLMKCVIIDGFKDFLILDGPIAKKYYGSTDIRVQLNKLYSKDLAYEIAEEYKRCAHNNYELYWERYTGFISKDLWEKFRMKLRSGKAQGIVYNGQNDHHACITFNPRKVVPIAVTNNRNPRGNDFTDWKYLIGQNLLNNLNKFEDFHSIGEKLLSRGIIKSYDKKPPLFGMLRVVLKNDRVSFFDTKANKLVSSYGFDMAIGFNKEDGIVNMPCVLNIQGRDFEFYVVPNDGTYYLCTKDKNGDFTPFKGLTTKKLDKMMGASQLNESLLLEYYGYRISSEPDYSKSESEFRAMTGLSCPLESVFHRTKTQEATDNIARSGFSPEYATTECYGHGLYTTLSAKESTDNTSGYGRYMIHGFVKDGFKNFLIYNETLAKKYYGNDWKIKDQLKYLFRKEYYDELMQKYAHTIINNPEGVINTFDNSNDWGKTRIRGLVGKYGNARMAVIRDWKCIIPFEYSTNDGSSWNTCLNKEHFNNIDKFKDGLFAVQKLIADGVVVDTFTKGKRGTYKGFSDDIDLHPQFINGFLKVQLTNGRTSFIDVKTYKLISYYGFDMAIGFNKESGIVNMPCVLNIQGRDFEFYVVPNDGTYYLCTKDKNGDFTPFKGLTTKKLDKMMGAVQ